MKEISSQSVDRRLKLRVAIKLLMAMALSAILYVFISAIRSGSGDVPDIPSQKVDVSGVQVGSVFFLSWQGRPILIYRRQGADYARIRSNNDSLQDAYSKRSDQPENAENDFRSVDPEWFVAIASGSDLGCTLVHLPASTQKFQQDEWLGGFADTCRKSRYDLAGRVFRSQYATRNLTVPVYSVEENTIILGRP